MQRGPALLIGSITALAALDLSLMFTVIPLLPVWERELGMTKAEAGIVLGAYSGAVLVSSIPAGRLGDLIGTRRLTLIAALAFAASAPPIGYAHAVWEIVAIRIVQGLASSVVWSAGLAWLASGLPLGQRGRGMSIVNGAAGVATVTGPVFGGPVAAAVGIDVVAWGYGAAILIATAFAFLSPKHLDTQRHEGEEGVVGTLRRAVGHPGLLTALVSIVLVATLAGGVQVLAPLHLDANGLSQSDIGLVFGGGALLSTAVALGLARAGDRVPRARALVPVLAANAACVLVLATGPEVPAYIVAVIAANGVASAVFSMGWPLGAESADQLGIGQGVTMGALNTAWALTAVATPIAAAAVASRTSDGLALAAIGVLVGVALVLLRLRVRRLAARQRGTVPS